METFLRNGNFFGHFHRTQIETVSFHWKAVSLGNNERRPRRRFIRTFRRFVSPTAWRGARSKQVVDTFTAVVPKPEAIARRASDTRTRRNTRPAPSMTSTCYSLASARVSLARARTKRRARIETATPRETLREATIVPERCARVSARTPTDPSFQAHARAAKTPAIYVSTRSSVAATTPRAIGVSFASKATDVGVVGSSRKRR